MNAHTMPNYCHIAKDKRTGDKFLLPVCYGCSLYSGDLSDREIIKQYCTCDRPAKKSEEKYTEKTKDEVLEQVRSIQERLQKKEDEIKLLKEELDGVYEEVLMLNLEEVIDFEELGKEIENQPADKENE